jgi:hypothetical protein
MDERAQKRAKAGLLYPEDRFPHNEQKLVNLNIYIHSRIWHD